MKLTSTKLVPSGGWYFQQGRYRINGITFPDLVANVTAHRLSNGIAVGNVESEATEQICQRNPNLCARPSAPPIEERPGFWGSIKNCSQALLGRMVDGLVSQDEANRRAAICGQCHNNVQREGVCVSCQNAAAGVFGAVTIGSKSTPFDKNLKACAICNCSNKTQVWFPIWSLQVDDSNRNAYPDFCWKKDI